MMSDNFWDNKSDADIVTETARTIEKLLKKLGAKDSGIYWLAKSIKNKLPEECFKQLMKLVSIRNRFIHDDGNFLQKNGNRNKYIELVQKVMPVLDELVRKRAFPTKFENISFQCDVERNEGLGLEIYCDFNVKNLKDVDCKVVAYFSSSGARLESENEKSPYRTTDGQVCVGENFTPSDDDTLFNNFSLFIPYSEFPLSQGYCHKIIFSLALHNLKAGCKFADSDTESIDFYNPPPYQESTYSSQYVTKKRTGFWERFKLWK